MMFILLLLRREAKEYWAITPLTDAFIILPNLSEKVASFLTVWKNFKGLDFFNKDIKRQDALLDKNYKNRTIVNGILDIGQIGIHTSLTYHSSIENKEKNPRVGMVVHFCTEKAKKIIVNDENANYLNQLNDPNTAPVIYKRKH